MKIDSKSGDLVLEQGVRIGPGMQEGGFLGLELGRSATVVLQSAFGGIYHFVVEFEPGRQAGLALKFSPTGGPEVIRLRVSKPGFRPGDWTGWTRNVEDERKSFHDEWLRAQLGEPPYSFPWGAINSYIDTRFQYSAEIAIAYDLLVQPARRQQFAGSAVAFAG
ncbi:MAG: hypothetical protein ACRD3S_01330 [Terracidiphilus sp.]